MLLGSQEHGRIHSYKQLGVGVTYSAFLAVVLSLCKTCTILITCCVKYKDQHGQRILTAVCPPESLWPQPPRVVRMMVTGNSKYTGR